MKTSSHYMLSLSLSLCQYIHWCQYIQYCNTHVYTLPHIHIQRQACHVESLSLGWHFSPMCFVYVSIQCPLGTSNASMTAGGHSYWSNTQMYSIFLKILNTAQQPYVTSYHPTIKVWDQFFFHFDTWCEHELKLLTGICMILSAWTCYMVIWYTE